MEAIAEAGLYIWHSFFGIAGCNNDLIVFDASPLISMMANETYTITFEYTVCGITRNKLYWLCNGIYQKYRWFLHSVLSPVTDEKFFFVARQKRGRKNIGRCFGGLQAKFHIIALICRLFKMQVMQTITHCYVILRNIAVDNQWKIAELRNGEDADQIQVGKEMECCYEREDMNMVRSESGMV